MTTLFISDLHLDDRRPAATQAFVDFLHQETSAADALYILGDLFEYWLGDDAPTPTGDLVAQALRQVADQGVPIHFAHGNRDFLLGEAYARKAGMKLLDEETTIDLYGCPTLLLHGDSLCTDDVAYQEARVMLRNPEWQQSFLALEPQERLEQALKAREMSAEHKEGVSMDIMDVNSDTVQSTLARHGLSHMIHGHTHRPAIHEENGLQRIVLGDWYEQGSVLRVSPQGLNLHALPFGDYRRPEI